MYTYTCTHVLMTHDIQLYKYVHVHVGLNNNVQIGTTVYTPVGVHLYIKDFSALRTDIKL